MKIVSCEFEINDDQCGSRSGSTFLKQNIVILINLQRSWIRIRIHIFGSSWIRIRIRKKKYGSATLLWGRAGGVSKNGQRPHFYFFLGPFPIYHSCYPFQQLVVPYMLALQLVNCPVYSSSQGGQLSCLCQPFGRLVVLFMLALWAVNCPVYSSPLGGQLSRLCQPFWRLIVLFILALWAYSCPLHISPSGS